jgi:putative spermidine/putrescine transport system substrate-binding protein
MKLKRGSCITLTLLGLSGVVFAQEAPPKPEYIVVNHSGGAEGEYLRKAYFDDFESLHGIKVVDASPQDFGRFRAMVESKNVEWQIVNLGPDEAVRAHNLGLLDDIDDTIVDRSNFVDTAKRSWAYNGTLYGTVIAYRNDAFPNGGPKNWADFWDVDAFPGPRSLRNSPADNLEIALLADGVPADEIYPIDFDRAFRKLDEIYPHITVWWTTGAQQAQQLIDKEVVLTSGWNGRFYEPIRQGADLSIEYGGMIRKQGAFGIPKGTPNAYWAQQMLAVMADPKRQAVFAELLGYSGTNKASGDFVDPTIQPLLPNHPDNAAKAGVQANDDWWGEHGEEAAERWSEWMLSK